MIDFFIWQGVSAYHSAWSYRKMHRAPNHFQVSNVLLGIQKLSFFSNILPIAIFIHVFCVTLLFNFSFSWSLPQSSIFRIYSKDNRHVKEKHDRTDSYCVPLTNLKLYTLLLLCTHQYQYTHRHHHHTQVKIHRAENSNNSYCH